MNFPKFSESKGILKIGRSEVCVSGGSSRVKLLNQEYVYIYMSLMSKKSFIYVKKSVLKWFELLPYVVYMSYHNIINHILLVKNAVKSS